MSIVVVVVVYGRVRGCVSRAWWGSAGYSGCWGGGRPVVPPITWLGRSGCSCLGGGSGNPTVAGFGGLGTLLGPEGTGPVGFGPLWTVPVFAIPAATLVGGGVWWRVGLVAVCCL